MTVTAISFQSNSSSRKEILQKPPKTGIINQKDVYLFIHFFK